MAMADLDARGFRRHQSERNAEILFWAENVSGS